jgi:hypothetical protein
MPFVTSVMTGRRARATGLFLGVPRRPPSPKPLSRTTISAHRAVYYLDVDGRSSLTIADKNTWSTAETTFRMLSLLTMRCSISKPLCLASLSREDSRLCASSAMNCPLAVVHDIVAGSVATQAKGGCRRSASRIGAIFASTCQVCHHPLRESNKHFQSLHGDRASRGHSSARIVGSCAAKFLLFLLLFCCY